MNDAPHSTARRALAGVGLLCLLAACQTVQRNPRDETTSDPLLSQVEIVDVAILPPRVTRPADRILARHASEECRRTLIDGKHYSVPSDAFVDRRLAEREVTPEQAAGALGSDAALLVTITGWETGELLSKGRIWAAGSARLYGQGQVLWERSFEDRSVLAPGPVTASNRATREGEIMRSLVRNVLSGLPRKRDRR